jgi:hypothetical protein
MPLLPLVELSDGLNHLVVRGFDFSPVAFENSCTRVDASVVSTFVAKQNRDQKAKKPPLE